MRIAFLCGELHCLPHAGGLLDQAEGSIVRLSAVIRAKNDHQARQHDKSTRVQEAKKRLEGLN